MARECPGRSPTSSRTSTNISVRTTSTDNSTTAVNLEPDDSASQVPVARTTTVEPQLTKAQQILTIEESMDEEERGAYLDARDMGEDFYSVGP